MKCLDKDVMFSPVSICVLVGLFVSRITQKILRGLPQKYCKMKNGSRPRIVAQPLVWIWTNGWIQECLHSFFTCIKVTTINSKRLEKVQL